MRLEKLSYYVVHGVWGVESRPRKKCAREWRASHHPMEQHGGGGGRKGWGTKHWWPGRSGVEKETVLFPLGYKKEKQKITGNCTVPFEYMSMANCTVSHPCLRTVQRGYSVYKNCGAQSQGRKLYCSLEGSNMETVLFPTINEYGQLYCRSFVLRNRTTGMLCVQSQWGVKSRRRLYCPLRGCRRELYCALEQKLGPTVLLARCT